MPPRQPCRAGADLDVAMEMAKGHLDDELRWTLFDILSHRQEWWVPGKIVEARHRLKQYWQVGRDRAEPQGDF